jgi:hypothetical protein
MRVVLINSVSAKRDHERISKGIEEITHKLKFLSTTGGHKEESLSKGYVSNYEN